MHAHIDLVCICNALVDTLCYVDDELIQSLGLHKGRTHLLTKEQRSALTQKVAHLPHQVELGGSGMNVARAMAMLGSSVSFTGMVGKDTNGSAIKEKLRTHGVLANIYETDQEETGSCSVLVSPDGERTLNTYLGASCMYDSSHLPVRALKQARVLHFTGYQWDRPNQIAAIKEAIKISKTSNTLISLDVSDPFVAEKHRAVLQELIQSEVDILFANQEEIKCLYGSYEQAVKEIKKIGCIAAIKMGADGAHVYKPGQEPIKIPAHPVKVVDTTGAGDSFAAGFLHGYVNDMPLEVCTQMAIMLAADVITRLGVFYEHDVIMKMKHLATKPKLNPEVK